MNLNLLISKYVDGDLTVEEDQTLRRLLSEQPAAKEAFDMATVLHFSMLEDADSIVVPNDFLLETETKIAMKFAAQEAIAKAKLREQRMQAFKSNLTRLSSFVVALLLICTVPFSDMFVGRKSIFASNIESATSNSQVESLLLLSDKENRTKANRRSGLASSNKLAASLVSNDGAIADNNVTSTDEQLQAAKNNVNEAGTSATLPLPEIKIASQGSFTAPAVSSNSFASKPTAFIPPSFSMTKNTTEPTLAELAEAASEKTEIQVSTFVANNVASSRENSVASMAVSQSIAYSLGENSRVGVEIGYKGYTYQGGGTYLASRGGTASVLSKSKILGADGPDAILPGDIPEASVVRASQSLASGFEEKKVEYSMDKTMYWGAAFYEYMVYSNGKISVNGRVGAGGSNDGGMAYTRAFARYDVVKGVALTLGAEANAFVVNSPMVQGKQSDVNSGVLLVYGMQIKF